MGIWLLITLAHADCDPLATIAEVEEAILEVRFEDAERQLAEAEESLACGPPITPEALGRLWLAEGALRTFQGDPDAATDAFIAARRVAPDLWKPEYGGKLEAAYRAVEQPAGEAVIVLEPSEEAVLDGVLQPFPATVAPGLHVVQVIRDASASYARMVYLAAGQEMELTTGLELEPEVETAPIPAPEPSLPVAPPPEPEPAPVPLVAAEPVAPVVAAPGKKAPVFLIAGGACAALAVGGVVGAEMQTPAMRKAEDLTTLDAAFARQKGFAAGAYTLGGLALTGVALHFAL